MVALPWRRLYRTQGRKGKDENPHAPARMRVQEVSGLIRFLHTPVSPGGAAPKPPAFSALGQWHEKEPPLTNLCEIEITIYLQVSVSTGDATRSVFLQRAVAYRLVRYLSEVLRLALCRLPAGTAIRVLHSPEFLPPASGRRRISLLGRRIGQRRRARVPTRDSLRAGCPTRASRPVAIRQEGLGFRRALLNPAGSPTSKKRILSYAQIYERSRRRGARRRLPGIDGAGTRYVLLRRIGGNARTPRTVALQAGNPSASAIQWHGWCRRSRWHRLATTMLPG